MSSQEKQSTCEKEHAKCELCKGCVWNFCECEHKRPTEDKETRVGGSSLYMFGDKERCNCERLWASGEVKEENWERELENSPAYQSLNDMLKGDIRFFIKALLADERERILTKIRQSKVVHVKIGSETMTASDSYLNGYNQALSDLETFLKENK